jgi:hypothetical protein
LRKIWHFSLVTANGAQNAFKLSGLRLLSADGGSRKKAESSNSNCDIFDELTGLILAFAVNPNDWVRIQKPVVTYDLVHGDQFGRIFAQYCRPLADCLHLAV